MAKSYYKQNEERLRPILLHLTQVDKKSRKWRIQKELLDISLKDWYSLSAVLHTLSVPKKYKDFLKCDRWSKLRNKALTIAQHRCQTCNSDTDLHCHHRTYNRHKTFSECKDLIILCARCHKLIHDNVKIK